MSIKKETNISEGSSLTVNYSYKLERAITRSSLYEVVLFFIKIE